MAQLRCTKKRYGWLEKISERSGFEKVLRAATGAEWQSKDAQSDAVLALEFDGVFVSLTWLDCEEHLFELLITSTF